MIIARSWVYLEYVSSVSTGGNNRGGGDGKTDNNVVLVEEATTTTTTGNTKAAQHLLTTTFLAHAKLSSLLPSPSLPIPLLFFVVAVILGCRTTALLTTIPVPESFWCIINPFTAISTPPQNHAPLSLSLWISEYKESAGSYLSNSGWYDQRQDSRGDSQDIQY